jgi:anti-sigma B factor antagonist
MTLETTIKHIQADTAIISFAGNLTLGMGLGIADSQRQSLIEKGVCRMVFDMATVPYIDSSGLGVLVHTYGLTLRKDGILRLCCVNERVAALLKMKKMDAVLHVDGDAGTSLAAINSPEVTNKSEPEKRGFQ